jgi:hypothetical protein
MRGGAPGPPESVCLAADLSNDYGVCVSKGM